jgi:REP element-mobilizing transposase RayT
MYNPNIHKRRSIRLKDYDYSKEGMYYITICTKNRESILGDVVNVGAGLVPAQVNKTHFGKIIEDIYLIMENRYKNIKLHDYVIMPNHLHGIIEICDVQIRTGTRPAPTMIYDVIRDFKSLTTLKYIKGVEENLYPCFNKRIWQRNYYEHIIRDEKEYCKIAKYIYNNPMNWKTDKYNENN